MKILLINSYSFDDVKGGTERMNAILAKHLKKENKIYMLTVDTGVKSKTSCYRENGVIHIKYVPKWPGVKKGRKLSKWENIHWHIGQIISPYGMLTATILLKKIKPDFVLISNIYEFTIGFAWMIKNLGYKYKVWVHDYNWLCINSTMYKKGKEGGINCVSQCGHCIVARATHKQFIQASDKIFISTVSAGTYNNVTRSNKKMNILANGCGEFLDLQKIKVNKNKNLIRFGFLGTPIYTKGLDMLIDEFKSQSSNSRVKMELHVGGENSTKYYKDILKKCSEYKNIIFYGYVETVEFFNNIDILILPSRSRDTYPGVCLEAALASKIVIIPSNVGAIDLKEEFPNQIYIYNDKRPRTGLHGAIKDIVNKWDEIEIDEEKINIEKFKPDIWANKMIDLFKNEE